MYSIKRILITTQLIVLIFATAFAAKAAGEVDPTFNGAAYGALTDQGKVNVVKRQPDGKILIGGQFTEVQGYAAGGLARLNVDGTVDRTFNAPDFSSYNPNNGQFTFGGDIYDIAVQSDGKIIVGGNIFIGVFGQNGVRMGIRRLNVDGSNDPTFFIELMTFGSTVYDIKLKADGKILLGGLFTLASNNTNKNLVRLNADGTHDTTFSANPLSATIRELEIQTDGKIVAGGNPPGNPPSGSPAVLRFNADGSADSSFTLVTSGGETIQAVELQADGKIIIGGEFIFSSGVRGYVARLNTDGTFDSSFSNGTAPNAIVNDIALRADGKIIVGGGFTLFNNNSMKKLARLNTDGSLDNTFTSSITLSDPVVNDVELLPDNRILAGFNFSHNLFNPLLRFNADGVFDSSFVVRATRGGTVRKILQQPDGKILVAGEFLYANGVERRSLARFNADGSLDTSFVPYFNNLSPLPLIQAIALQPDGKIIVGAWHGIVLQRLNADGSQDTSFFTLLNSSSQIYDVLVQTDGKILAGGNLNFPPSYRFARFNTNGSFDTTFNLPQPNGTVYKLITQPDGKLLIGGSFSTISDIAFRNGLARYNANGGLDTTFNPPDGTSPAVVDMDLQADGKIVHVGAGFRRLNSNGTLDISSAANSQIEAVKIQPDGKILIGGGFSIISGVARNGIARLNANFAVDPTFTTFANRGVSDIQLQSDGKILLGGGFTRINGVPGGRIARLLNAATPAQILFDYDGDGRSDVSVFRPSTNRWYLFLSGNNTVAEQTFGIAGDVVAPADYDGDGKTDIAIFRPSNGNWWYLSSVDGGQKNYQWGASGDIPRPGDFDGDGKADFIIFRPSENNWYRTTATGSVSIVNFGTAGDKPVTGDFDGDGKSDVAIYRPSTGTWWYRSSINNAQIATQFGISTDIPVAADFDGDGKTDLAVYRASSGTWYIQNSGNGQATIVNFGLAEDKPVAADYDGDGKADIAVFRPSTGIWYVLRSTAGFTALQFGISNDTPTPNAFVP
jgi:uncharacterized delta-60 repeat protein